MYQEVILPRDTSGSAAFSGERSLRKIVIWPLADDRPTAERRDLLFLADVGVGGLLATDLLTVHDLR